MIISYDCQLEKRFISGSRSLKQVYLSGFMYTIVIAVVSISFVKFIVVSANLEGNIWGGGEGGAVQCPKHRQ